MLAVVAMADVLRWSFNRRTSGCRSLYRFSHPMRVTKGARNPSLRPAILRGRRSLRSPLRPTAQSPRRGDANPSRLDPPGALPLFEQLPERRLRLINKEVAAVQAEGPPARLRCRRETCHPEKEFSESRRMWRARQATFATCVASALGLVSHLAVARERSCASEGGWRARPAFVPAELRRARMACQP